MTTKEKNEQTRFVVLCILGIIGAIIFVLRFVGVIPQIRL